MQVSEKKAVGNQTMGRGKLYLGNSAIEEKRIPTCELSYSVGNGEHGTVKLYFATDDITFENQKMWLEGYEGEFLYVASNPCGPNVNYSFKGCKARRVNLFQIKSDDWQKLRFVVEVASMEIIWPDGRRFLIEVETPNEGAV